MIDYSENIISIILTQGRKGKEVSASMLYDLIKPKGTLQGFQRTITNDLAEYFDRQLELALKGKSFNLILSNSNGYYLVENLNEAVEGKMFYQKRLNPIFAHRKKIGQMIAMKFQVNYRDKRIVQKQENQLTLTI